MISIEGSSFSWCTSLSSITIPENVTNIGVDAFGQCYKLAEVVNNSNLEITTGSTKHGAIASYALEVHIGQSKIINDNGCLFYTFNDINYLVNYIGNDTVLALPDKHRGKNYIINDYAFYYCESLVNITIPNSVTSIGKHAFSFCTDLKDIIISDSVTNIGESAFAYCPNLQKATLSNGLTNISPYMFEECESLLSIVIPDGVTEIGKDSFLYCRNLMSVTLPKSVTKIGDSAFGGCVKLVEIIDLASIITAIGSTDNGKISQHAIDVHEGESRIVYENGYVFFTARGYNYLVNYIGTDTQLVLPENYNGQNYTINDYAFYNNSSLISITIPKDVTKIYNFAFANCKKLISVTFTEVSDWICSGTQLSTIHISSSSLEKNYIAAYYLKNTYCKYNWTRE